MNKPESAGRTMEPGQAGALDLTEPRRVFAMGLIVAASVVISFGGVIMRNIEQADAWQINFYRASALVMAVALILAFQYRRDTLSQVRGIGRWGLLGGAMLAGANMAFVQALTHTTVANTLFTLGAIPFITAALARFFLKERLRRATLITMVVAATGVFAMVVEGFGIGSAYGNGMGLVTAFCFSGFTIIVRRNRHINMIPTVLVSGAIVVLIALAMRFDDLGITLRDVGLCFIWGGVLAGFANWGFIVASRHLVAAELTLFMMLEFALGPLWVWLFVAEVPTHWTLAGGTLVITSVTVRALIELRRTDRRLKRGRPSPT